MKKPSQRKLQLDTITIATLDRRELAFVIGGGGGTTGTIDENNRSRTGRCPVNNG